MERLPTVYVDSLARESPVSLAAERLVVHLPDDADLEPVTSCEDTETIPGFNAKKAGPLGPAFSSQ